MNLIESTVTLEKIIGTDVQIETLFDLLNRRVHNISNKVYPQLAEHIEFVRNHPYRVWYLVKINVNCIGAAYIMKNNCIGINLISDIHLFPTLVKLILKTHKPLKEIKSVRPSYFYINIASDNIEIEDQLAKINAPKIQSTFILSPVQT